MNKNDALKVANAIVERAQNIGGHYDITVNQLSNISNDVLDDLPPLLRDCVNMFDDQIEKDVVLIGALGVLSSCFPNLEGVYFGKSYTPHLYCFITAMAGSGKGNLDWAKLLGSKIHESQLQQHKTDLEQYDYAIQKYDNLKKHEKLNESKPIKPSQLMHFIPGNSSSAAIIQALTNNNDRGIIFETEADTVSNIMCQEWGDFSDVLRKAFHHETVSLYRKTEDAFIEMKRPMLSMVLSGTPKQVSRMITDSENGLFSRFLFYGFEHEGNFKNPFEMTSQVDYKTFFEEKGSLIYELHKTLAARQNPIQFELTREQQSKFTEHFNTLLNNSRKELSSDFEASIKRLGLIAFRIAMILSIMRYVGETSIPQILICNDEDFYSALSIVTTGENHAANVFVNLLKGKEKRSDKKSQFYDALPSEFTSKDASAISEKLKIPKRTETRYLGDSNFFERISQGVYRKLESTVAKWPNKP
ncbi:DUF3987 domain-containing protein [Carboxylicivirga sp. A043]|uniref:YfjI family protein n=1 Tax=Carboxylicivirga litoralis TaxID=2816963 RepID=UPI0021CAF4F5|nr:YfjI family protein [Carboxylicivirga sp. A043]MCU4158257.1 DUF3987 domain-containing protein [Carboxylicivirga sp. A043]